MKIIPNNSRILVKQIELDQSKGMFGLVMPKTLDRESKTQGKIIQIGGSYQEKYDIGQTVFYGTFAGEKIKVNENGKEQEYILLEDNEILGWLE